MNYQGIIDKERNPFSRPSWYREGNPEGSGKVMSKKGMQQFEKLLDKRGRIDNIIEPNFEKYLAFQAIR